MSNWVLISAGSTLDLASDLGFSVEQALGTGMAPVDNVVTDYGWLDGGLFQRTRTETRSFTLVGTLHGTSVANLHSKRKALINAVKPDRQVTQGPVTLRYSGGATVVQASAFYDGGLELGQTTSTIEPKVALRFIQPDPYWEATTSSSGALTIQAMVASANYILQRNSSGSWYDMNGGVSGEVRALKRHPNTGILYAGGGFLQANGTSTSVCNVAYYNGTWNRLGDGGADNGLFDMNFTANGDLYIGGNFESVGGIAASGVAMFDGSTWSELSGSGGSQLSYSAGVQGQGIAVDANNYIWVAGAIDTADGATACNVAYYDGTNWTLPADGLDFLVYDVVYGPDTYLYFCGTFTATEGGTAASRIAYYDGTTMSQVGPNNGIDGETRKLAFGPNNKLYAGGDFSLLGGLTASGVAAWTGGGWEKLGDGLIRVGGGNKTILALTVDQANGQVHAGGRFNRSGSLVLPQGFARYVGGQWLPQDVLLPAGSATQVMAIDIDTDGTMTIGFDDTGTASVAGVTTVTNSGTANAYPVLAASGPGQLVQLVNWTTGDAIYFNYALNSGETVSLDLRPGAKTFTSNVKGNVLSKIVPSSNLATFKLAPGSNVISCFLQGGTGAATLTWTDRYWSLDG